jgi:hypothetical protein
MEKGMKLLRIITIGSLISATALALTIKSQGASASPAPKNGTVSRFIERSREVMHEIFYQKRVDIIGLTSGEGGSGAGDNVRQLLPEDRSVLWWHLNRSSIGTTLSQLPRVESATITRCQGEWSFRCFEVHVQERKPVAVALVADYAWVIGADGGFIEPLPHVRSAGDIEAFIEASEKPLVGVVGLGDGDGGPELLRGRLRYVHELIRAIESEVGSSVRFVELDTSGEARVFFKDRKYPVRFGFSGSDLSVVSEEARRFKLLLSRLEKRDDVIKEIDVAFQKAAVVRLK